MTARKGKPYLMPAGGKLFFSTSQVANRRAFAGVTRQWADPFDECPHFFIFRMFFCVVFWFWFSLSVFLSDIFFLHFFVFTFSVSFPFFITSKTL